MVTMGWIRIEGVAGAQDIGEGYFRFWVGRAGAQTRAKSLKNNQILKLAGANQSGHS
jgi:hypothetical protein